MNITVVYNETGEQIFSGVMTLEPGENVERTLTFREPGNYSVMATIQGTTYEYIWHLERTPPSHELIVNAENGDVNFTRSAA